MFKFLILVAIAVFIFVKAKNKKTANSRNNASASAQKGTIPQSYEALTEIIASEAANEFTRKNPSLGNNDLAFVRISHDNDTINISFAAIINNRLMHPVAEYSYGGVPFSDKLVSDILSNIVLSQLGIDTQDDKIVFNYFSPRHEGALASFTNRLDKFANPDEQWDYIVQNVRLNEAPKDRNHISEWVIADDFAKKFKENNPSFDYNAAVLLGVDFKEIGRNGNEDLVALMLTIGIDRNGELELAPEPTDNLFTKNGFYGMLEAPIEEFPKRFSYLVMRRLAINSNGFKISKSDETNCTLIRIKR